MTMTSVRGCSYNPMTNTLSLSESFVKKASRLGTAEYKMVLQYQKDHPDLKMVEMEKKPSEHKRDAVTYTRMEQTIKLCRDSEARMKQYERINDMCNSKFAAMCRFNPIENSARYAKLSAKLDNQGNLGV